MVNRPKYRLPGTGTNDFFYRLSTRTRPPKTVPNIDLSVNSFYRIYETYKNYIRNGTRASVLEEKQLLSAKSSERICFRRIPKSYALALPLVMRLSVL